MENIMNVNLELDEDDLTAKSLRRMKWLVGLALPGFPMITGFYFWARHREIIGAPELSALAKGALLCFVGFSLFSILCFMGVCINKKLNTVFRSSKNLDEWALKHKLEAESFAYKAGWMIIGIGFAGWAMAQKYLPADFILPLNGTHIGLLAMTAMSFMLLLPALHLAWSLKPLDET